MAKKKTEYKLLTKHYLPDGKALEAGDTIKLTDEQAINLSNKIRGVSDDTAESDDITALQNKLQSLRSVIQNVTAAQLWDCYSEAVGGTSHNGDPLPSYDELGKQTIGWEKLSTFVHTLSLDGE